MLSHKSSLRLSSGHWGRSSPFRPHLLVVDAGIWGTFLLGVAFRHIICGFYLFSLPVRLTSKIRKLPPDPPVRGFPGVWKLPLLRLPSRGRVSFPSSFVSLFIFYILSYLLLKTMGCFSGCLMSSATIRSCFVKFAQCSIVLSMNLQGRKWSPCPIPLPSWLLLQLCGFYCVSGPYCRRPHAVLWIMSWSV